MNPKQKNILIKIAFTTVGIIAGILFWKFVGCKSGTCPLTSNWYSSGLVGGISGLLLSDSANKNKQRVN